MRKIIGLFLMLLALATAQANAAVFYWNSATLNNNSTSPVWVTVYTATWPVGPWTIVKAACVLASTEATWPVPQAAHLKIRAQAEKGHGGCGTGAYWDGHQSAEATTSGGNMFAKFQSLPHGASELVRK